ncbi:hypothetical protein FS837_010886 [Tulasnella sp. UAMH 9824]|nr:hypothetical protein FS837_010886 [Tulasnella sp. UAMH 9824]
MDSSNTRPCSKPSSAPTSPTPMPTTFSTPARPTTPSTPSSTPKYDTNTTNTPTTPQRTGTPPPLGITPAINRISIEGEEDSDDPRFESEEPDGQPKLPTPAPKKKSKSRMTLAQARELEDTDEWQQAAQEEIDQLKQQGTWKLVNLPEG